MDRFSFLLSRGFFWLFIVMIPGWVAVSRGEEKPEEKPELSIVSPASRLVFQRGPDGRAALPVAGECLWPGAEIEARIVDVSTGEAGGWTALGATGKDFRYRGSLTAPAGWHSLEVRVKRDGRVAATASVERVGVGEVFVVAGHSVAHGGELNLPGAEDERVCTIALPPDGETLKRYQQTGDPGFLPEAVGSPFSSGIRPAPAGNGTYFWAAFAERVARKLNVPVLILNAAFGGTSLEHWAKSSRGETFEHSFVNASLRMPFIRLEHALTRYCAVTGLRAILSDQGQNDWPERDADKIAVDYRAWIDRAREVSGFPDLAVVVNRQTPPGGHSQVRRAQQSVIDGHPRCFAGPDYDTLAPEDRTDGIHLSESGMKKAAQLWADALDETFFESATPWPGRRTP